MHRSFVRLTSIAVLIMLFAPSFVIAGEVPPVPFDQEFIVTAYYSPLPGQCCYVKGGLVADRILNGEGRVGADGTPVYPGMLAAPASYAFNTRVELPGIGTLTVHDRGGAIVAGEKSHRLDVWVGSGEEGLARALAFGVQHIHGRVYPVGTAQPVASVDLSQLAAPLTVLQPYSILIHGLLDVTAKSGDRSLSVLSLQDHLRLEGFLAEQANGFFGPATVDALKRFASAFGLSSDGQALTKELAAYLEAAAKIPTESVQVPLIGPESSARDLAKAQRLLRFLGLYRGRTDGTYSPTLQESIVAFQKSVQLVADSSSLGAGRIGPKTRAELIRRLRSRKIMAVAQKLLVRDRVEAILSERGTLLDRFLAPGDEGPTVRLLQTLLALRGFFPSDATNGVFGERTKEAVTSLQRAIGVIDATTDDAGGVGPKTLTAIRQSEVARGYRTVRQFGWGAL